MNQIGKLSSVAIRAVWPDETADFTPWLANNADRLGEALGMDLDHEQTEAAVGQYSADLVFRDVSAGRLVVVENMLGTTDHDHLGKLITYAAGLKAGFAVLLAHKFRDEHRSALNWLNSISADDFGFFGIVLDVWSIGDSPPAPQLRIDVQPDNWSRSVRAASRLGLREQTYQRFWGMFLPAFHEAHPGWSRAAAPTKDDAMRFPSGRSNVLKYIAKFCRRPDGRYGLRAEARIDTRDEVTTKEAYDELQRRRREIEQAVGQELEWERLEGNRRSRISHYFPDDIRITDEERWSEAQAWLIKAMGEMRAAFDPVLRDL